MEKDVPTIDLPKSRNGQRNLRFGDRLNTHAMKVNMVKRPSTVHLREDGQYMAFSGSFSSNSTCESS